MANVKNFGLVGVGTTVQFGKAGPTLSRDSATVLKADGTAAFILPVGTTAQQPTGVTGMLRFNDDLDQMEYYNGTAWTTLATGGATVSSFQTSLAGLTPSTATNGAVTLAGILGAASGGTGVNNGTDTITTEGNVNFGGTVTTAGAVTLAGAFTTTGANPITLATTGATSLALPTSGTLLVDTDIGTTVQAWDAGLDALAAKSSTGILVQTGADTYVSRSLVQPAAGLTITNADGVAGNPTFALANDLAALEGLATTGYIVRTGDGTATTRSFSGTAGNIVVTNGDGVASNTSINLDTVTQAATGDFVKVTLDTFGRVTGNTAVVAADITTLVGGIYVNVSGDTMDSGANLTFAGGGEILGLPTTPSGNTAATSKAYVDSLVAGLSWKQAVRAATTANITLSSAQTIDGVSVVAGNRVLVKNQTTSADNGIYVAAAGAWTRSADADTASDLNGAAVYVQEGTVNADSGWTQTAEIVTLGTDPVTWVQFSGTNAYVGGTGIDITGNTISANLGAGIGEFNTDNIGIDLFDTSTGAIILTTNGTTRSTSNAAQLQLLLDGAGALAQGASGLRVNAASVTNAMLVNDSITTNADSGTDGDLALGGTLEIAGTSVQGITTAISGSVFTISASNASSSQKGVASFDTVGFTVTAGNVVLNDIDLGTGVTGVLPVANGGTNVSSLAAQQVLYGGAGGTAVAQEAAFAYNAATNTLTVGDGTIDGGTGGDLTITATALNADINLNPNGTGSVVVGPGGSPGLISSDTNQNLTVQASGTGLLTLTSGGDTTMVLPSGTGSKVTVSGPTAADYATSLADADLVNKYYVDQVASAGGAGDVKAVMATVNLGVNASTNIGAALPAGATILSVKVNVTVVNTTSVLVVGKSGGSEYMTGTENDPQTTGLYLAETMVTEAGSEQVQATVTGQSGGVGSCVVIVTYKLA